MYRAFGPSGQKIRLARPACISLSRRHSTILNEHICCILISVDGPIPCSGYPPQGQLYRNAGLKKNQPDGCRQLGNMLMQMYAAQTCH